MADPETTVEEARSITLEAAHTLPEETIPVQDATGFVLAEDVEATEPVQPFRNAAMDGYAVRWNDVKEDPEQPLIIAGEVAAGEVGEVPTNPGECVRIMTGAPVPEDLDTVIRREDAVVEDEQVHFTRLPSRGKGDNVRNAGEDIQPGDRVLQSGQVIRPYEIGTGILGGRETLSVYPRPRVAVISTGDELVGDPGAPLKKGQIRDVNRHTLQSAARQAGARVTNVTSLPDDKEATLETLDDLIDRHDVVMTSGGISMGDYDFIGSALEQLGVELTFHKIWQKPGKPLGFAQDDGTLLFALPGNVVSSLVNFEIYVRPVILRMRGLTDVHRPRRQAQLEESVGQSDRRSYFLRGQYSRNKDELTVRLTQTGQGSHVMTSMSEADCLIELPPRTKTSAGDTVITHDLTQPVPLAK